MAQVHSRNVRILIVEDNVDARDMYVLFLEMAGIDARGVGDAESALDLATEWQPDIVMTDFMLGGGMNGAELCRRLHDDARTAHIPTLVMTGSTRRADVESILGAGCADIRVKPYLPEAMLEDIQRLTPAA